MDQTGLLSDDVEEEAEVGHARHLAGVFLAQFHLFGELGHLDKRVVRLGAFTRDDDDPLAILLVDFDAHVKLVLQPADHLAAGTNQSADLLLLDLQRADARRKLVQVGTRFRNDPEHLVQDMQPGPARLGQGLLQDIEVQPLDLDVHLQGGDSVVGASHLEVHVAQVILQTLNVGQDLVAPGARLLDQPHGHSGHRLADWHTGIHQRQRTGTDGGHAGGTVAAHALGHQAEGVGEVVWHHACHGAFRQSSVANLAPSGTAHHVGLARRVGREVVVVHVGLLVLAFVERVHALGIGRRAQRSHGQDLGFASLEQAAAMDPGNTAHLHRNRTDGGGVPTVTTDALIQDALAHSLLDRAAEGLSDRTLAELGCFVGQFPFQRVLHLLLKSCDAGIVGGSIRVVGDQAADSRRGDFGDALQHLLRNRKQLVVLELGFAELTLHVADHINQRLHGVVRHPQCIQHDILRHLIGASFDHENVVACAGYLQVELALLHLGMGRIDDQFTVNQADRDGRHRFLEINVANRQGRGCCRDGQRRHQGLAVAAQRREHNLHGVAEPLREQGPQGSVRQPAQQDGRLAGTSLPTKEAAGDAPGGVHPFLEIHCQREEIGAFPYLAAHRRRSEHHRVVRPGRHCAAGLLGQHTGLQNQFPTTYFGREHGRSIKHLHMSPQCKKRARRSVPQRGIRPRLDWHAEEKSNKGLSKNADKPRAHQGCPGCLAQAFTDHGPRTELGILGKGRYLRNPRRSIKVA